MIESYEEDDLFKDLYGDEEIGISSINCKKKENESKNPILEASNELVHELNDCFSKIEEKTVDLSCNTDVKCVTSQDMNEKENNVLNDIPCVEKENISKSVEQTVSEGTGSTIREDGKMFIGGLNWETTDESLRAYFEQFGEVTECNVMRDSSTSRSRGFGFLTFKDPKCVNTVMVKEHYLDGKIIDPKRAIPREEQEKTAKMFVGGVSQDCTEEEFKEFFSTFGRVIDATLMIDKDTGRPRGFGFVTFESEAAVENVMAQPYLAIHDKQVEVKRATPKGNVKERMNMTKEKDINGYDYQRNYFNKDNSAFNFPMDFQNMQQFYGGMSPAVVAQYYQRMQAYMAAMQNMGRGMQVPGGMGRCMMPGMPGFPIGMNIGPMDPMMMNQMNGMMSGMTNFNNVNMLAPQMAMQNQNQETFQVSDDDGNINNRKDTVEKDVQKTETKTPTLNTTVTPSTQSPRPTPPPNAPTGPSKSIPSRNHRMGYSRGGRGHSFHPYQRKNQ